MNRWKRGAVAMVTAANRVDPYPASYNGREWASLEGGFSVVEPTSHRPLVVIDPEDREQVARLYKAYATTASNDRCGALGDALRSLVTPPKPEEPQGLGAVVEDAEGERWVRSHTQFPDTPWTRPHLSGAYRYGAIDAVRVLSKGWSE